MLRRTKSLLAVAGLCTCLAATAANGQGADVIVGELPDVWYWGQVGSIRAYSVATTSCNIGTQQLLWIAGNNQHPVIAQNLYRIKDGRLQQIGMSWLKHGFCALQQTACGACQPAGGGCIDRLGLGCSDPYGSSLNGEQARLGPRNHVNAFTGHFPYPFTNPGQGYQAPPPAAGTIGRRLQVHVDDLNPALNTGAVYMVEGQYVSPDDAAAGNGRNNASYRRVNVSGTSLLTTGATQRQKPAIHGWKDIDFTVNLALVDVPGEGRFYVAGKTVDNGDGTWTYNYAVYNINSHASAGSFSVPVQCGTEVTNVGFSAPLYHSGEPYSNAPWATSAGSLGSLVWSTESFAANPNANALRWGTTYSFWFTANAAPSVGTLDLGLFRTDGSVSAPSMPVPGPARCRTDWNGADGVNSSDLSAYITSWIDSLQNGGTAADFNCDGTVNSSDISAFISSWLTDLQNGC